MLTDVVDDAGDFTDLEERSVKVVRIKIRITLTYLRHGGNGQLVVVCCNIPYAAPSSSSALRVKTRRTPAR